MTSHFQNSWLEDERFKGWIKKKDETTAICTYCFSKEIKVGAMGESALLSHSKAKKHQSRCPVQPGKRITGQKASSTSSSPAATTTVAVETETTKVAATVTNSGQARIDRSLVRDNGLYAEMRWCLKVVMLKLSFRSCDGIGKLFKAMFPNCHEAEMFALGKTKCSYFINFGFAPHFVELLVNLVKKSPFYSLSFDESLNKVLQNGQMDLNIRFWNYEENQAETRYYSSEFLGRAQAEDILETFVKATSQLEQHKLVQVGSDGPNVNLNFLELYDNKREFLEVPSLVKTGTCGLHTVHGSLKAAIKASGWELGKVLKAMHFLLHDFPSRQDIYIKYTESSVMPTPYCGHRWCENEKACERAAVIWKNYIKYIDYCLTLPKSKQPQGKRFECLVKWRKDPLMPVKFKFVEYVAMKLNGFLKTFQTDKPMMPFLYDVLMDLVESFMQMFINKEVCDSNDTLQKLLKLDFDDVKIRKKHPDVGVGAKLLIVDYKKGNYSENALKTFYRETGVFLAALVRHMLEKSPLQKQVIRCASSLDPKLMADKDEQEACIVKFSALVTKLAQLKQISDIVANKANEEYKRFLIDVVGRYKDEFKEFKKSTDRLDCFLVRFIRNQEYTNLFTVSQLVFVLFHGQAHIERGFKTNKDLLRDNLSGFSLVNLRIIHEHMMVNGYEPHSMPLNYDLVKSVRNARNRYQQHLEEESAKKQLNSRDLKRQIVSAELDEIRKKKVCYENVIKQNTKDADRISEEAENNQDFALLSQSNSLRKANLEKLKLIEELKKIEADLIARRDSIV